MAKLKLGAIADAPLRRAVTRRARDPSIKHSRTVLDEIILSCSRQPSITVSAGSGSDAGSGRGGVGLSPTGSSTATPHTLHTRSPGEFSCPFLQVGRTTVVGSGRGVGAGVPARMISTVGQLATSVGSALSPLPGKDVKVSAHERQVVPSAVLFHLAFMGQAVMKDLELLRGLPPNSTALETALRLSDQKPESNVPTPAREIERFFTADSDPSQEAAVMEARRAPGLVVEGPPGTGKSQTIVNMVADAIGMGKSLLVVCQKQAALEVVRKRLEKERLGNRFVMITDINSDREAIVGSIREQVEHLHGQPTGGAPTWKRDRDRLAARIEMLEADLDRQQVALHAVDPRTGLTYRTLLGELLAIEAGEPKPIDLPSIRPMLADLHPADVVTLEENCGPLARFWLPAKFESSTLSVLKLFNPDRGTADALVASLRMFADIDARREKVDAETSDSLEVADPEALRLWLAHAGNLRSIGDALCSNLGRWLPLFRSPEGDGSRGTNMLAGLIRVERGLSALDASRHEPGVSEKLVSIQSDDLRKIGTLVAAVVKPASGLGRINPIRWIRKRRLRNLMATMDVVPDDEGILTFESAIDLEMGLRPLRLKLERSPAPAWWCQPSK